MKKMLYQKMIAARRWTVCILTTLACASVIGCQVTRLPDEIVTADDRLVAAAVDTESSDLPTTQPVVELVTVASPQLRPLAAIAKLPHPVSDPVSHPPSAADAVKALVAAKQDNTELPRHGDFLNANQVYDYAPGVVFTAVCAPGFVTTLMLQPDEVICAITAGDTTRWQLETVEGGGGATGESRTFILLKPAKAECETNLVIITDQRVYQLDLKSVGQAVYHTQISWNYPGLKLAGVRPGAAGGGGPRGQDQPLGKFAVDKLNFNYLIKKQKGQAPAWCPLRAFDDGAKTYVQFTPGRLTSEAPPLFVLAGDGEAQVVNYRVKGDYYIVDRLFDRAELRLGEHPQQLVRIERGEVRASHQ